MAFAHPEPLSSDTPPSSPDQLPERTRRTSRSQPPSKRHTRVTSTDDARRTTDYGDEDSHSRAHRSHHRSTSSSRFIARVLTQETDDARKMSSLLLIANERLESETRRANDAERRALDLISRFREAIQSRDTVAQDSARLREELSLYKLQLDNAQREIFRAQETIQTVAREKQEAESDAARSRSQARALMEEKAVMLAREEGRRSGFREGLERGRLMGVAETRRDVVDDRYSDEDSLEIVTRCDTLPSPPAFESSPPYSISGFKDTAISNVRHSAACPSPPHPHRCHPNVIPAQCSPRPTGANTPPVPLPQSHLSRGGST
ncbi:hypothetical protein FIBSPDRAFT_966297 [Athelia psychrophila]|uniref:Uncharacterized protein n=1 Tax=Athelia psychrophila TaxID=1759441 RepID=A0A167WXD4_9AGAM|nr:hypothetical protein FIBSPDRAFT_966297 [Fibularhizoctonia sp. CBS 109695]